MFIAKPRMMARRAALNPYTSDSTSPITYVSGKTMNPPSVMIDQFPMTGPNATPLVAVTLEMITRAVKTETKTG